MQLTVLGTLVAKASGSALAVGIVMSAQFVPGLVGAPIGGILADRYDRRVVLLRALSAQTIVTTILAVIVAMGERRAPVIAVLILIQGLFVSLGGSVAGTMQPDLVPTEELLAAVSLGSASWNTGRVVGPAIGFVVERWVGATGAVVANAISFAVMAVAVWSLRRPYPPAGRSTGTVLQEVRFGATELWRTPGCRAALQGILPMQLLLAPMMALLPILSRDLKGGQGLTSLLSSSQGVGAVLGAAMVPWLVSRFGRDRTLQLHWVASASLVLAFGFISAVAPAIIAICLFGGAFTGVLVTFMALMQRDAPAESRGRVMSIFMATMGPTYGISVFIQSSLADAIGRNEVHQIMGMTAFAVLGLSLIAGGWKGWQSLRPSSRSVPSAALAAP
jgi:MFS family permease